MKSLLKPHIKSTGWTFDAGMLVLRVAAGGLMMPHGFGKLQRAFSGNLSFADPIGLSPEVSIWLAGGAEFVLGFFVLIGLFTRISLIPLIFTMLVIVFIQHGNDPISEKELPILFLASYITIFLLGTGKYSIDNFR